LLSKVQAVGSQAFGQRLGLAVSIDPKDTVFASGGVSSTLVMDREQHRL